MKIDYSTLRDLLSENAAFRRIRRLQPIGGKGDKIFPPTYPDQRDDPCHVFERRRVEGEEIWCVLVDSVQSQANRLEEVLLSATDGQGMDEPMPIPRVTVDFRSTDLDSLGRITSLDAPHRVYDSIMRDSLLEGIPFMQSDEGRRLAAAKPTNATALLEISPTTLVFGAWHSQGQGGGLGAKFSRTLVSEIMAVNTPVEEIISNRQTGELRPRTAGRRTGSRIDPLGILRGVDVFKSESGWDTDKEKAGSGAKKARPSEIIHGNIRPSIVPLGVTCDYVEHRVTITLAGIRRLHFGNNDQDAAGRALVSALGLFAVAEQDAHGYALRSRCDLVCEGSAPLELVSWDGSTSEIDFDRDSARTLYRDAYRHAEEAGFKFRSLTLKPQDKLIEIVQRSRELALEGKGAEDEAD